ncbi:MAG: hypothetical protein V1793_04515 [Pseudomonadota bacterium]
MYTRLKYFGIGIAVFFYYSVAAMALEAVQAVSVNGFGEYSNDAGLLIDLTIPPEESDYMDPACVYWYTEDVYFIIDLGAVVQIQGVTIQADNNDDYNIDVSENGNDFVPLIVFSSDWGEMGFGMETVSTVKNDKEYVPEAMMSPIRARYLKLSARGGDGAYAVSEVLVFGEKKVSGMTKLTAPALTTGSATLPAEEPVSAVNLDMEKIFNAIDADHDGKVSLDEYAAIWKDKFDVPKNFAYFDKNGSGCIERAEYLGLAENLKTRTKHDNSLPSLKPASSAPSQSAERSVPPALQGGIRLKLDPEKVRNALSALKEWSAATNAISTGNLRMVDEYVARYHFENWFDLNFYMNQVCIMGTQLMENPASKDQLSSTYGQEVVEILCTTQAWTQLKNCPR